MTRDGAGAAVPVRPAKPAKQPRARGRAEVSARLRGGVSRIGDLHQAGSSKLLFPQVRGAALQAVSLNTAGGVTGGDQFHMAARAEAGAHLVMTTQAAERVYRAQPGEVGQVQTRLTVAQGGRLDWLPQETILYNHAALHRRLDADLASGARLLAVEPLILGRSAMGEVVQQAQFRDCWRIRRDGALVFADNLSLSGDVQALMARSGTGGGAGALASLLLVDPDADLYLDRLRDAIGGQGGASLIRPGVLFARVLGTDGFDLRRALIPAVQALSGADIPKTWML